MAIEFDPEKSERNEALRGLPFSLAEDFEWDSAKVLRDDRRDYGEDRFVAVGVIDSRVHVLVYTVRGENVRVISLRRANDREVAAYERP